MVFACASMPTRPGLPLCLAGIEMFRKVSRPTGPPFGQSNHPRSQRCALRSVEDTYAAAVEEVSEDDTHTSALPSHGNSSVGGGSRASAVHCPRDESGRVASQEPRVSTRKHISFKVDELRRGRSGGHADIGVQTGRATAAIPIRARRGETMEAVLAVQAARLDSEEDAESGDGAGQEADVGEEGGEEGGEGGEGGDVEEEEEEEEDEEEADLRFQHERSLNNEIAYWDSLRIHLQRRSHPQRGPLNWPSPPSSPPDHSGRALDIIRAAIIDDAVDGEKEWKAWGAKAA